MLLIFLKKNQHKLRQHVNDYDCLCLKEHLKMVFISLLIFKMIFHLKDAREQKIIGDMSQDPKA